MLRIARIAYLAGHAVGNFLAVLTTVTLWIVLLAIVMRV